ncbi:hypothetical protein SAMN02949497_1645 [Methylomagnum ishizawai]|uniref:Uncharacterized protein n=1 Tax=Methylomagnum ishizawai TaxID=1760988 RepID=A0A1Y6D2Y0_9GAMM|nr:hypothetical protein [Methylomagnum ishizawai]SMF94335.1 hypothetical protein SAMN02949497_1645 [Methylomagnum ishizawai]
MQLTETKRIFEILRYVAVTSDHARVGTEEIAKALRISHRQATGDVGRMVATGFLNLTPDGRVYLSHFFKMAVDVTARKMGDEGWHGEEWDITVFTAKERNKRATQFWNDIFGDTPFGEPRKQTQEKPE